MFNEKDILKQLKENTKKAYAPYSQFNVSAILITKSGKIYTGVNVENASYGGTVCAERVAMFKAVSEGDYDFDKIYIYSSDKNGKHQITPPCGFCRQVMVEFAKDMEVVMVGENDILRKTVRELVPCLFDEQFLKGE